MRLCGSKRRFVQRPYQNTNPSKRRANLFPQRYQNIIRIGAGGTAVVYSAWDTTLERKVAIKRVKDELTQDKNFLKRVKREVKVLAKLKHPTVPTIFDFHFQRGNVFYVMQFIEGVTLKNLMKN